MSRSKLSALPTPSTNLSPWKHQKETIEFFKSKPRGFDFSDPGCVSADTEFLTPNGWVRIDAYAPHMLMAQFDPVLRAISFIKPLDYVKAPCNTMITIAPLRGTSQMLSAEHRVLYYTPDGEHHETSANEFVDRLHRVGANHNHRKFATSFRITHNRTLSLSEAQIRVMVAVIADGHFPHNSETCTMRLKKRRKIERLRALLLAADIPYAERQCGGQPDFQVFRFTPPRNDKQFSSYWWNASQGQLYTLSDELPRWDGSERKAGSTSFCSTIKASADFAQYVFAATGNTASLTHTKRNDKTDTYDVHVVRGKEFVGPGRAYSTGVVPNPEGFKYCFTTETSYWLARRNGYIFATGNTGKTRSMLEVYRARKTRKRLLVVCPKTLMSSAWGNDIERFTPELTFSLATAENREAAFILKTDVVIINIDGVKWLADKKNQKYLKEFDHLIIDEGTAFKHPTSKRSKAMVRLRKFFKHRYLMTGTPNANSVMELWNLALIVDDGASLGTSYFKLRAMVQTPTQVGPSANHLRWDDKPGIATVINELLADITIRHVFEDVMTNVPANHRDTKTFTLNKKTKALYDQFERSSIVMLKETVVTAVHAAALRTRLLQLSSGAVYTGGEDSAYEVVDTQRYELITDLVEERKHSIVFFNWTHQRDQLCKAFEARDIRLAVIDGKTPQKYRDEIVAAYQRGEYQTLLLHPKTGAHGLTLTRGTATIIASPFYEADLLKQAIHRIYRGGQTEVTNTILVCAKGTVEEKVYDRLFNKEAKMVDLLDLLSNNN